MDSRPDDEEPLSPPQISASSSHLHHPLPYDHPLPPPPLSASMHSSAAAFVKGGLQDACDDACSICLESFCDSDPSTVTTCKHDYHLQCILEWAQRSKECPMCWQPLHFEDPNSQELLDAVEQERKARTSLEGIQFQIPSFVNYADFEERLMQHLAHQLARRGTRLSSMHHDAFLRQHASRFAREQEGRHMPTSTVESPNHGGRSPGPDTRRHETVPETSEEGQQRTLDFSSLSGSLKSRFLVASSKCKETLTKTTRSFKERWQGRNGSTVGLKDQAQGVNPDVVRHTLTRVSPDDIPTTSSSAENEETERACSPGGCASNDHLENRVVNAVRFEPPSEAV